jgi:hypothetical protein
MGCMAALEAETLPGRKAFADGVELGQDIALRDRRA